MNRVRYKDIPGRRGIIFLHPDGLWHTENFFIHQPVPIPKSLLRFAEIESYELPILPKDLLVPKIGIWNPISDVQSVLSDNPILIYERLGKRIGIQKNYYLLFCKLFPKVRLNVVGNEDPYQYQDTNLNIFASVMSYDLKER